MRFRMRKTSSLVPSIATLASLGLILAGCTATDSESDTAAGKGPGCIEKFDPNKDYFPDKAEISEADNFSIQYENSYQVLTVNEPFPGAPAEQYVLVKCGAPAPKLDGDLADAPQISIPVQSLYSASTTHLPMLEELDALDALSGVSNGDMVTNEEVAEAVESGEVAEYAADGAVDVEKIVADDPEVLITGGVDDPSYAQLRNADIDVLANAEWLEKTALGRAEWIKYFGALTDNQKEATEDFNRIAADYKEALAKVADVAPVNTLMGNMNEGTWYMPTAGSYTGKMYQDAAAVWPWENEPGNESLPLDFEAVIAKAADAKLWIVNTAWESKADALKEDDRYSELAAMDEDGQVWNANKATNANGGNDYWESGVLRPDLVLKDLIAILHPDLMPGHEFVYFQELK